jgi:uncharacterized protein (TIGR03663 family)
MSDDGDGTADGGGTGDREPAAPDARASPPDAPSSPDARATESPASERGMADGHAAAGLRGRVDDLAVRLDLTPTTVRTILGIALVGLLARLAWLGHRVAHFDEGRVAYWALRFRRTGHFEYRSILHGPLVQHVDRWLFALLGPSDFAARLPVALAGAALPLVVLWYRDHLDDLELVGMAGLLAVNPILLYYSRFLRSDLLVATFMLATLGALLRLHATGRPRYIYAAAALGVLGFASKENAAVYVLCWLGAGVLLLEGRLFRPHGHATGMALVRARLAEVRAWLAGDGTAMSRRAKRAGKHLLGATALAVLLALFLFAPRAGAAGGPGLWRAVADPTHLPELLRATAMDVAYGFGYWFGGAGEPGCRKDTLVAGYGCFLWRMSTTVARFALATALLGAVGFLRERYAVEDPRPLVMFAGFWGIASVLGYPLGTDIWAAWVVTHVVVPLSIPAAAGFAAVLGLARRGIAADRERHVVVAIAALVVLGAWTAGAAAEAAYVDPVSRDHPADMVQYAQPADGLDPAVGAMGTAVEGHDGGPDVVYYGSRFNVSDESVAHQPPVPRSDDEWFDRLPLPWYDESMNATVVSTGREGVLLELLADRPPVVVTAATRARDVRTTVDGYRTFHVDIRAHTEGSTNRTSVVVFVDQRRLD